MAEIESGYTSANTLGPGDKIPFNDGGVTKVLTLDGSDELTIAGTLNTLGVGVTGDIAVSGTVDGRDVATDGTKLDGVASGATAGDASAIHDDVAGEIAALTEKATPVSADKILIEDSAAADGKKYIEIGNLPGGGGGDVVGPASATDNAVARFDATTGELLQNSAVTIDDSGNVTTSGTVDGRDVSVDGTKLDGIASGATAGDAAAIHDDVGGEIAALTQKATPIGADHLIIEDSAASNAKRRVLISSLPSSAVRLITYSASGRWSAITGTFKGPSQDYGPNNQDWNIAFGSPAAPDYKTLGFIFPRAVTLTMVSIWYRPSAASMTFTAQLVRQRLTDASATVTNVLVGTDLTLTNPVNTVKNFATFDLSLNADFETTDQLVPVLTCTDASNRFLYFTMTIEAEER